MKYKSTIERADSFNAVLMTQNGFPIYDIMVPSNPGYCRASGMAFYTENEDVLKKFQDLDTKERKEFLLDHPEHISSVQDILKQSPEMNHPMPLAYNHLVDAFEQTVRKGNYGSAHLIEGDKLMIFHQTKVFHITDFKINNHKEFNDLYDSMQSMIEKAYKEGKISPDGIVSGKALERLKAKNPDMFKEMTEYQEKALDILKSFKRELLEHCKLVYDKGENLAINMEINYKSYIINIPPKSKDDVKLTMNNHIQDFSNINDLIVEVYKDYSQNKLNNFMKKMKM